MSWGRSRYTVTVRHRSEGVARAVAQAALGSPVVHLRTACAVQVDGRPYVDDRGEVVTPRVDSGVTDWTYKSSLLVGCP